MGDNHHHALFGGADHGQGVWTIKSQTLAGQHLDKSNWYLNARQPSMRKFCQALYYYKQRKVFLKKSLNLHFFGSIK